MYESLAIADPQAVSLPFMETIRERLLIVPKPHKPEKLHSYG